MTASPLASLDSVRKLALLAQELGLLDQLKLKLTRERDKAAAASTRSRGVIAGKGPVD